MVRVRSYANVGDTSALATLSHTEVIEVSLCMCELVCVRCEGEMVGRIFEQVVLYSMVVMSYSGSV